MTSTVETTPVVRLTESAAAEIRRMLAADPDGAGKGLRLFVETGGCSGRQYGMEFAVPRETDHRAEFHGVTVLVDRESVPLLAGSVVDFSDDLNNSGFKLQNPNARSSCGCGKSFEA